MTLSQYMDALRARCHLTSDRALAKLVGVNPATINHWRSEKYLPGRHHCDRIAALLSVPAAQVRADVQAVRVAQGRHEHGRAPGSRGHGVGWTELRKRGLIALGWLLVASASAAILAGAADRAFACANNAVPASPGGVWNTHYAKSLEERHTGFLRSLKQILTPPSIWIRTGVPWHADARSLRNGSGCSQARSQGATSARDVIDYRPGVS